MDSQPNSELTDIPSNTSEVMNLYLSHQMRSVIGPLKRADPSWLYSHSTVKIISVAYILTVSSLSYNDSVLTILYHTSNLDDRDELLILPHSPLLLLRVQS